MSAPSAITVGGLNDMNTPHRNRWEMYHSSYGTGAGGTDNDTPSLAVSSVSVAEDAGYAVFTVSLSNPASAPTSVNLALSASSATAGADYTPALQVSTDGGTTWTAATADSAG